MNLNLNPGLDSDSVDSKQHWIEKKKVVVMDDDDMYSIYLRGKVYVHLCTVQIGVRLSTWYVRYNKGARLD